MYLALYSIIVQFYPNLKPKPRPATNVARLWKSAVRKLRLGVSYWLRSRVNPLYKFVPYCSNGYTFLRIGVTKLASERRVVSLADVVPLDDNETLGAHVLQEHKCTTNEKCEDLCAFLQKNSTTFTC